MNSNTIRDVLLVLVAIGLLVAVFLPINRDKDKASDEKVTPLAPLPDVRTNSDVRVKAGNATHMVSSEISPPIIDAVHMYFPIAVGSIWEYRVTGSEDLVQDETWSMQIDSLPTKDKPGEVKVGFGKNLDTRKIWIQGETIRTDAMPFVEPLRFFGNAPTEVSGTFLPAAKYIIEGAVWKQIFQRKLLYDSRDKQGKVHVEDATAVQSDRAFVHKSENIITPVGVFEALKITWLGRIEIKAKKNNRRVLVDLTAAPYREDTIWIASGIGIVRRTISYSRSKNDVISFDLSRYHRPTK